MRRVDVEVDVTASVGTGEPLSIAASVFVPEPAAPRSGIVFVAYPGGGYNRDYYDLRPSGQPGHSQAAHHTGNGHVFVSVDHLAVGASSVPEQALDFSAVCRANVAAAREIVARLGSGGLSGDIEPCRASLVVGLGHSYGGFTLVVGQAADPYFDAVGVLGYSATEVVAPWPDGVTLDDVKSLRLGNGLSHPMRPYYFHDDVPTELVRDELTMEPGTVCSGMPWSSRFMPGGPANVMDRHPRGAGAVGVDAAAIEAPVLCLFGDVDVSADPRAEVAAYRGSDQVLLRVIPSMRHLHNFAGSRAAAWRAIEAFAELVMASIAPEETRA